ncbi:MAG TPA: GNAT family N-acetyltransferase [Polyangiaceae bacterium]
MLAKLAPHHRSKLAELLTQTPEFTPAEVDVALELIDAGLASVEGNGYRFVLCEEGDHLLGYACFGHTPMTESCFDLYWLVVSPAARGRGVGRWLVQSAEQEIVRAGGRIVRVETAGLASYRAARTFYERAGYVLGGHIRDFYAASNDLYVFVKYLEAAPPSC